MIVAISRTEVRIALELLAPSIFEDDQLPRLVSGAPLSRDDVRTWYADERDAASWIDLGGES